MLGLASALVVLAALGLGAWLVWSRWLRMPAISQRVLVTLRDQETTIEGVLVSRSGRWLVFADCEMLTRASAPVPLDGQALVDIDRVLFLQDISPRRRWPTSIRKDSHAA